MVEPDSQANDMRTNDMRTQDVRVEEAAALHMFGVSAFRRGNVEAALKFMSRACAHPEAPVLWHRNHAEILDRCGRSEAAEAAARLALSRDPENAGAWETLGTIMAQRDKHAESSACYEKAIEIAPNFVQALNNLAVTLDRLGQHQAAEMRYRQVLRLAPESPDIQLNFATLLGDVERYQEGLEIAQDVLDRYPDSMRARSLATEFQRNLKANAKSGGKKGESAQRELSTSP
ncbi:MAG TPA: tetratricopeptide repeat protein [Xanthobacteraceae bacterium]|nr:tetratricopeptide repeat protein [Xanthobacteraceae bacterium]